MFSSHRLRFCVRYENVLPIAYYWILILRYHTLGYYLNPAKIQVLIYREVHNSLRGGNR